MYEKLGIPRNDNVNILCEETEGMQPNLTEEGRIVDPAGYELSFPHIKLATPEDEVLNKSLLESLAPSSPTSSAPYRLPKLSSTGSVSSGSTCTSTSDRLDGPSKDRSSQDAQSPRSVKSKGSNHSSHSSRSSRIQSRNSQGLPIPPYTIAQLRRAQNIHVPTFKKAQFAPLTSPVRAVEVPGLTEKEREESNNAQAEMLEPQMTRASTRFTHASRSSYGLRSAAVSMTIPMAKGSGYARPPDQKPEWRLSPYRHKNYDNQAVSPNFGPYSRGFVIHCSTPKSWLQMKLRRTKTTLI